jgi:hypothetical protein
MQQSLQSKMRFAAEEKIVSKDKSSSASLCWEIKLLQFFYSFASI